MSRIRFVLCCYLVFLSGVSYARRTDSTFFPIAVWLQSTSNAEKYKEIGINMYVGLYKPLDEPQLIKLKQTGLKVMCGQNDFGLKNISDHTIFGWTQDDEPDNAQWNASANRYDPCVDPKIITTKYHKIKHNDPTRPVYLNLGRGVSYHKWIGRGSCTNNLDMYKTSNSGYLSGCDIASFDIYPVNSNESEVRGNLWYVGKGIDSLRKWSDYKKPVWTWIETTLIGKDSPRKPRVDEVKFEVWSAIIHGAKGIGYFCHSWNPTFVEASLLQDTDMSAGVKEINKQISSLAGIINSKEVPGAVTAKTDDAHIPVDILAKRAEGADYIFAATARPGQSKVTFKVSRGVSAVVIGENRVLKIKDNTFADSFGSYGVHLYKITSEK